MIRNNIIGLGVGNGYAGIDADYNLWIAGDRVGSHDPAGDARFVNAPLLVLRSDTTRLAEMTVRRILFRESLAGRLAVGDVVEVLNTDGSARDGRPRRVTAASANSIEIGPPLAAAPDWAGVFVYKWPAGQKDLVPDCHLRPGSPAIDSADGSVGRGKDRDGREAIDVPGAPDTGAGAVKHLDRGAFEFAPAETRAPGTGRLRR